MVPLQYLGSAESEISAASSEDLLMHALANLSEEGGYAVQHGTRFVSTFPNCEGDNETGDFSTRAFPTLFPYGLGGIEVA